MNNVLKSVTWNIFNNIMNVDFVVERDGIYQKGIVIVNGNRWISFNLENFIKDDTRIKEMLIDELKHGAYKFFI